MKKQEKPFKKLRLLVMFSKGASGLRYLIENDPNFGNTYELVGCFTDNQKAEGLFIPEIESMQTVLDYAQWCTTNNCSKRDMAEREKYFAKVIELVKPYNPDVILLSGFMLKITPNMVTAFKNRIINVHPANLRICDDEGKPIFRGDNAVKLAMDSGEKDTSSTVHFVTDEVDCGKIICISQPLYVEEGISPEKHQEKMKTECDGPAIKNALQLLAHDIYHLGE